MKRSKVHSLTEWYTITRAKSPRTFILIFLLLANLLFFLGASLCIFVLAPKSIGSHGFFDCVYYAITMVLDAGCITNLIEDVGTTRFALIIICLLIVVVGMILFTGTVIGYVTNSIGAYISNTNTSKRPVRVSGHMVILNWNNRASEIINDLLYSNTKEVCIILADCSVERIQEEIEERLYETIKSENRKIWNDSRDMPFISKLLYRQKRMLRRSHVAVIVREGDTVSSKQLNDISIKQAKAVIVLGEDFRNTTCMYNQKEIFEQNRNGNTNLIKTLIQAADMTAAVDSADDQQLIVEVDDKHTMDLVSQVVAHKKRQGKNNIVPITADRILGRILSQFSLMPELSIVYEELFSNKGAAFYSRTVTTQEEDNSFIQRYLSENSCAVPLSSLTTEEADENGNLSQRREFYFISESDEDVDRSCPYRADSYQVKLNPDYWISPRNVIILGHNTKCTAIMEGFNSFRNEWNYSTDELIEKYGHEILNITVIDEESSLERLNYYRDYPYVNQVISANVFDQRKIMDAINTIVDNNIGDTSILILSDDSVVNEDIDATALTYLIYVQEMIHEHKQLPGFDPATIDVIVEILNPNNHDVVQNYSTGTSDDAHANSSIVISNRYISKMVTQISEKKEIFNFYSDILVYDTSDAEDYSSKELYVKQVDEFFLEVPGPCTPAQLVRSVFEAGPANNKSIVMGYVERNGGMHIFSGDLAKQPVIQLRPDDKIIIFSNH